MDNNFEIKNNKVFFNINIYTCKLLAMIEDNILIKMSGDYEQYAIGVGFNFKTKEWNWEHYFDNRKQVLDYFSKNYIKPVLQEEKRLNIDKNLET